MGKGAGVVCSLASFWGRVMPPPRLLLFLLGWWSWLLFRLANSVARKYESGSWSSLPQAKLRGQRLGTTVWMALREVCSPLNMVEAEGLEEIFMKKVCERVVEMGVEVRRKVEVKPLPPWGVILVVEAGRESAPRMAGSIWGFGVIA